MTFFFFAVILVCKNLQLKDMCIDEAIQQLKGLLSYGFENALIFFAKKIPFEKSIEPKFREKCISHRKK